MAGVLPDRPSLETNFSFQGTVHNAGSYANALYFVIYSYGGYYNLQRVTDELINPLVNLPRCGATSIVFAATLYLLANCAYLAVLPLEIIKSSNLTVAANL
jgi:amino acid transporter